MGWVACAQGCVTAVSRYCRTHRTACPTNTPVRTVFCSVVGGWVVRQGPDCDSWGSSAAWGSPNPFLEEGSGICPLEATTQAQGTAAERGPVAAQSGGVVPWAFVGGRGPGTSSGTPSGTAMHRRHAIRTTHLSHCSLAQVDGGRSAPAPSL